MGDIKDLRADPGLEVGGTTHKPIVTTTVRTRAQANALYEAGLKVVRDMSSNKRHIWMTGSGVVEPIALCGAPYDGRTVEPGANREKPVCSLCESMARARERIVL